MAANMQQMAGPGGMMPQQRQQLTQIQMNEYIHHAVKRHQEQGNWLGWQAQADIKDRMVRAHNLISNIALALGPSIEWVRAAEVGLNQERDTFTKAGDKQTYDQAMNARATQFMKKRQENVSALQNSVQAQAAAAQAQQQHQQQHQQQQFMMNQAMQQGRMGQNMGQMPQQQNLQHMQYQMQNPHMTQQQMMSMGGAGGPPNANVGPNQQMFQMGNGQPGATANPNGAQGPPRPDSSQVLELAQRLALQQGEGFKNNVRNMVRTKFAERAAEFEANGKDPAMIYFQHQAFQSLRQGMPQNGNGQAAGSQQMMQAGRGQMNPNMLTPGSLQQQQAAAAAAAAAAAGNEFGGQFNVNMESIMNQQKAGFLAQEQGQMVVPASSAGGAQNRNATPQPNGGVQGQQGMQNQAGPNQTPRPAQNQPQFNMQQLQQQQQQQQAQLRQQQMQQLRQPNAAGVPPSQSPGMNTLNTPMRRPPSALNNADGQGPAQANGPFPGQLDPRFNQGNQRPMPPNPAMNNALLNSMMATMSPEQRQQLSAAGPEKIQEYLSRWQESQRQQQQLKAMRAGNGMPQGQAPNRQPRPPQPPQQQQVGQFNATNPANQMQMGNGMMPQQQPPQGPNAMNGPNPQNQMIMNQQAMIQRLQKGQQTLTPQQQQMMDTLEIPGQLLNSMRAKLRVPPEIRIWKQILDWAAQNLPDGAKDQIAETQKKHFISLAQRNFGKGPPGTQQAGMGQQQMQQHMQQPGQQPPMQNQNPQLNQGGMPQNVNPNLQQQLQQQQQQQQQQQHAQRQIMMQNLPNLPPHIMQVSPQEIQNARAKNPKAATMPEEQIRQLLIQQKQRHFMNMQMQQQMNRQQGQPNQQPMGMPPQNAQVNPPPPPPQQQQQQQPTPVPAAAPAAPTPQMAPAQPTAASKQTAAAEAKNKGAGNNRTSKATTQSPATMRKNLKRPSPDDGADVPATQAAQPQQASHAQMSGRGAQPTPEQSAAAVPDQRAKNEQFRRAQSQQGNAAADYERLRNLGMEAQKSFRQEKITEAVMSPEERALTVAKLQKYLGDMGKVGKALGRWFGHTRDETRAQLYFRARLRLLQQFKDGDAMTQLKDTLTIRIPEIDEAAKLLQSMILDCAAIAKGHQLARSQESAPLSHDNLEKQTAELNKTQHNRSTSKGQPPAAPTTAQPPFPFGAASPHGNPSYALNRPTVNRDNLQLPPRKKTKTGEHPTPPQATPSPQISKTTSPEAKRIPEPKMQPAKPAFKCSEPDCDTIGGFPSEAALSAHNQEEHVKPLEDPIKFMQDNLALALGLDANGQAKNVESVAKSEQTPGATPMSRGASTLKPAKAAAGSQADGAADPWANTIDPQSLFTTIGTFEFGAGGAIADMKAYRSMTPNDTPESSKDSGASEPNSDIAENSGLDMDIKWRAFDSDLLMNMNNVRMDGLDSLQTGDASIDQFLVDDAMPSMTDTVNWDDVHVDFDKPFVLDTSMFSLNVS